MKETWSMEKSSNIGVTTVPEGEETEVKSKIDKAGGKRLSSRWSTFQDFFSDRDQTDVLE